ncbi:MAG: APC family permease [Legionellales bacterium]|nr:APC family permease [Legionellales bacterium]
MFSKLRRIVIGPPRNPLSPATREHVALIALFAWIGLGADGLSSSCYGPEESFLALGAHQHLGLYLAIATALTVFIIALSYNQVIELFPNGGGGYKVATKLLNPSLGLLSGAALIVDYVLTIAISVASGVDAFFSLLPLGFQDYKLEIETVIIIALIILNLRGMKESIKILMPIFIGFVVIHAFLIVYGIFSHGDHLGIMLNKTVAETKTVGHFMGWGFVIVFLLRAYSLGGGTYTGIEAVSNNVNTLAEPRVRTGKWTMFYMALSLSFTAAGITLLYLLWEVHAVPGKTLNAVAFESILAHWQYGHAILITALALEAGMLFVAANTGFLGGPAVLANMALDSWVPNRFRNLSNRLVTQNGIILFGIAALFILFWSHGHVSYLIVLYSIDVFLTFTISLVGLTKHWILKRPKHCNWKLRLAFSSTGMIICASILLITTFTKFFEGGWFCIVITGGVVALCMLIKRYYRSTEELLKAADQILDQDIKIPQGSQPELEKEAPTAVFFINKSRGAAMHTILWAQRLFPNHFKNYVFVRVGVVDVGSFNREQVINSMQREVEDDLTYCMNFAHSQGIAAKCYRDYGIDPVQKLTDLSIRINKEFPNSVFFACQLLFSNDNWLRRILHNDTATNLQRRLHLEGMQMVILPMKLS